MTKLEQKTFMGASIRGFNSNVGWGSTSSTLTVDLVVDAKNGDNFVPIPVGLPAYFEYYDYYFGGIVQKYEQQNNTSGSPLFSVVLQDSKELLQGVQIITNKYFGSTYSVPNVYNVYGYYESTGFGNSLSNSAGMPWKLVRDGFTDLVKTTPINYRDSKYTVDFSSLDRLPDYYRIGGESNITAFEFISKICQDSAVDFYLKLLKIPIGDAGESAYYNLIKLYLIDRSQQPELGKISKFINQTEGAVSKSIGVEFRNQNNNKFLVGGQKLSFYGQYRGLDYTGSLNSTISSLESSTSSIDDKSVFYLPQRIAPISIAGGAIDITKVNIFLQSYTNPFWGTFGSDTASLGLVPTSAAPDKDCGDRDYFASEQTTPFKNYFTLKFHTNPRGEVKPSYFFNDYILKDKSSANIGIQQYMGLDLNGNMCLYKEYERTETLYNILLNYGLIKFYELIIGLDGIWRHLDEEDIEKLQQKTVTYTFFAWRLNLLSLGLSDELGWAEYDTDFDEMEYILQGYPFWKEFIYNASQRANTPHYKKLTLFGIKNQSINDDDIMNAIAANDPEAAIKVINMKIGAMGDEAAKEIIKTIENDEVTLQKIYNALYSFATQFWGKKFAVKIPQIQVKVEPETGEVVPSHFPVSEGYIDESEYLDAVLKNVVPLCANFKKDNKISAFLRFDRYEEINAPSQDYCGNRIRTDNPASIFSNGLYEDTSLKSCGAFMKATVDENLVFINAATASSPRVVLTISDPVIIGKRAGFHPLVEAIWNKIVTVNNARTGDFNNFIFNSYMFNINDAVSTRANRKGVNVKFSQPTIDAAYRYAVEIGFTAIDKDMVNTRLNESWRLFCELNNGIVNKGGEGINTSSSQYSSVQNEAYGKRYLWPDFAGVPLLSNVDRYGPWYNVKAFGGTDYERDDELVPWRYGSYTNLNNIARAKIDYAGSPQQESESGSLEFPGAPKHSIGDLLIDGGPYINGISVGFNNGGVRTTYRLETWSPQYGNFAKSEVDRMNRLSSYVNKVDRLVSNLHSQYTKDSRAINRFLSIRKQQEIARHKRNSSPVGFIKATSNTNGYDTSTETSTETKLFQNYYFPYNLDENDYQNLGYMSLDGVFRPFSTDMTAPNSSGLPHFEFPSISGIENRSIYELNPFPSGSLHDVNFIARGNELVDDLYTDDAYTNILKGVGLRAPMVLVGWGYDTDGNPVPNSGIENDGVANQEFMYNHYKRADKWKAGPLDVAWDDARKVWTAVGGGGIFLGRLTSPLNYKNVGTAALFSPSGVKENGEFVYTLSKDSVQVVDWLLPSGGFIGANTDVILGKNKQYYFVIGQACGPEYFNTTVY